MKTIGYLWSKVGSKGYKIATGYVEVVAGYPTKILLMPNFHKNTTNSPDFKILILDEKENKETEKPEVVNSNEEYIDLKYMDILK